MKAIKAKATELRTRLKSHMANTGLSDIDVASQTGASLRTVQRFLDGETKKPQPLFLRALYELLGKAGAFVTPPGAA